VVTTRDLSAVWKVNDICSIVGKYKPNVTTLDSAAYTIQSITGTSITFTGNLDYKAIKGAFIVNDTHAERSCGVKLTSPVGVGYAPFPFAVATTNRTQHVQIAGLYALNTAIGQYNTTTLSAVASYCLNATKNNLYRNIFISITGTAYNSYTLVAAGHSMTVENIYLHSTSTTLGNAYSYRISGNNVTVKNIMTKNTGVSGATTVGIYGNNATVSGVVLTGGSASRTDPNYGLYLSGAGCTGSDIYIITCYQMYGAWLNWSASTINNLVISDSGESTTQGYDLYLTDNVGLTVNDAKLGTYGAAYNGEIYCEEDKLIEVTFNNCAIGAGVTNLYDNLENTLSPSYLAFDTYNTTANDHRVYKVRGITQSTGTLTALADPIEHTAGGLAWRFEPLSSTNRFEYTFDLSIPNLVGKEISIAIYCRIAKEAYWAGTYQFPRLSYSTDNGASTGYISAAQIASDTAGITNDGWQMLSLPVIATTDSGVLTITLSGMTDATTTNSYVYWDDWTGGSLVNTSMDKFYKALPVPPAYSFLIDVSTFWDSLTSAHKGAGTFGKDRKSVV
jgi:hypothetical protein